MDQDDLFEKKQECIKISNNYKYSTAEEIKEIFYSKNSNTCVVHTYTPIDEKDL
jgi:ssDNA-specific exonuclease RecJ